MVLSALLIVGAGVVGIIAMNDDDDQKNRAQDTGYSSYETTSRRTTTSTTTTTTTTTTSRTTTTTTSSRTSSSTPTSTTPAGPRPVLRLGDNPLMVNGRGLPAVTCALPRFGTDVGTQQAYFVAAIHCLDQAWAPVLQAAGLPHTSPRLVMVTGSVNSDCGTRRGTETAMYCGQENTIYWTYPKYSEFGMKSGVHLGQLAHEYGHHVQNMSGINKAYWNQRYAVDSDSARGLELSRRSELQATCFGGMALGALGGRGGVSRQMVNDGLADSGNRGDWPQYPLRDHGAPRLNKTWVDWGYSKNHSGACNTWTAGSNMVA